MNKLQRWWTERTPSEKRVLGLVGAATVVATGGAAAYAIATGGAVIIWGGKLFAIGAAATQLANGRR